MKYKKTSNSSVKTGKDTLDDYFPKLGTIDNYVSKPYWEFLDENKNQMNSICKTGECASDAANPNNPTVKEEKMIWKKVDGADGNKNLKGWCEKFTWWEKLYSKNDFDLEDKIKNFSGKWSLDNTSSSPGA